MQESGPSSSRWTKAAKKEVGPLSRTAAWKAGCFWEETKGDAKVFLEKSGEKKEVNVEKLIGKDGPRCWFRDKMPGPPQQQVEERPDEQTVTEDAAGDSIMEEAIQVMSEIGPGEVETGTKMWLRRSRPWRRITTT